MCLLTSFGFLPIALVEDLEKVRGVRTHFKGEGKYLQQWSGEESRALGRANKISSVTEPSGT